MRPIVGATNRTATLTLRSLSFPARWATVGALAVGLIGAVAGLAIGLHVDVITAWFGIFELGIPATIVGGAFGFLAGGLVAASPRVLPRDG
jgi:hypothetical protein